ncbi:carbohydrate sulfotransferase 1-like [Lytechinus variegatus]|uniref:carbohydrate sulfotransferase 1-like n=1 Tax=Lytechinus variegatus TaxID=7654 RepID=UPI001BB207E0|nr:carbohydrate sulfotransferase 1-like [Lytechinus variegatus]
MVLDLMLIMGRCRIRLKVLTYTFMCFVGLSLLVILQGLNKLVDQESDENPYSTRKRLSPALAPAGDANPASIFKVVLRDDNIMQIDLLVNYSSMVSAKKVVREDYGPSTHRKTPVSNEERVVLDKQNNNRSLHDVSRTNLSEAILKRDTDRIQDNGTPSLKPPSKKDIDEERHNGDRAAVRRRDLPNSQKGEDLDKASYGNQKNYSTNQRLLIENEKVLDKGFKISDSDIIGRRQEGDEENAIHDNDYEAYVQETNYFISQKPLTIHAKTKITAKGSAAYRPQFVILLAQMRTGSSAVGQILNQNKDIFYLYEPLHVTHDWVTKHRTKAEANSRMTEVLSNISRCEFSKGFVRSHGSWGGRTKSRALMPLCKDIKTCKELQPAVYKQICLACNGNVAVKLIRSNLLHLKPLLDDDLVDVRIIQLVRDPRGTANSRLEYFSAKKDEIPPGLKRNSLNPVKFDEGIFLPPKDMLKLTIKTFCSWLRQSLKIALSQPAWLQGRYMLIRYEDFAERPRMTAQEIYNFLGRPTPPEVLKWIKENTQGKTIGENPNHPLFSLSKNSSSTASRWRLNLSGEQVMIVQNECEDSMRLLGYQLVGKHSPLKDLSVSLIKELTSSLRDVNMFTD